MSVLTDKRTALSVEKSNEKMGDLRVFGGHSFAMPSVDAPNGAEDRIGPGNHGALGLNVASYTLPSVSYNTNNSGSSGFCDASSTVEFMTSATCSSYSVSISSSRSNSFSNDHEDNSSLSCYSTANHLPQQISCASDHTNANIVGSSGARVILVPDAETLRVSHGAPKKTTGPVDMLISKIAKFSLSTSPPGGLAKSQSSNALYPSQQENCTTCQTESRKSDTLTSYPSSTLYTQQRSGSPNLKAKPDLNNQVALLTASSTQALILENRPENLPQKDPKEAKKHLEQYRSLLEEQKKRELDKQKSLQKKFQKRCKFADDMSQLQSVWLNDVIPNWSELRSSRRVRDMWWLGVPPKVRAKLWPLAIGNCLNITPELFDSLSSKSVELINLFSSNSDQQSNCNGSLTESHLSKRRASEDVIGLIKLDVSRTFVRYKMFQEDPFYRESLQKLLAIFVCYRHDISYIQGMNSIAAVLLLNMDLEPAFICFANLINRSILMNFFALRLDKINHYYRLFHFFFAENLAKLCNHFTNIELTPKFYLMQWILSLFSNVLPLDISSRIWDVYLLDGDIFLFRAALGLLKYFEEDLMKISDFTEVAQFFHKMPDDIDVEKLFALIRSISLSRNKFRKYCEKFIDSTNG